MEVLLSSEQDDVIRRIAEKEGFTDFELETASGSAKGDNYLGVITSVSVKNHKRKLELIMKSATKSEELRKSVPIQKAFLREIYLYETILPTFETFQAEEGLPDSFIDYARMYGSCSKDLNEFLILENLKKVGYQLWDRKVPMTADHVALVFREYGKLHAASLAMKEKKPEQYGKLTENLAHVFVPSASNREGNKTMIRTTMSNALKAVKRSPIAVAAMERFSLVVEKFVFEDMYQKNDELVVLHGDCWCNNLLFKYEDSSSKTPTKLCFIDWQLSSVGSPAKDLAYFLMTCAPKEIISDYEKYLKIYHDTVCDILNKLHCDAETIYPFSLVMHHWQKYVKFGIHMSLLLLKLMVSDSSEVPDMAEVADTGKNLIEQMSFKSVNNEDYEKRLTDVITVAAENNWL